MCIKECLNIVYFKVIFYDSLLASPPPTPTVSVNYRYTRAGLKIKMVRWVSTGKISRTAFLRKTGPKSNTGVWLEFWSKIHVWYAVHPAVILSTARIVNVQIDAYDLVLRFAALFQLRPLESPSEKF